MADTKVTGLTENTTPALTDLLYIVDDPGGTPASQKVTLTNIKNLINPTVAARYSSNAGQSIANNTVTIVNFEDQDYDTNSAVTTGASWKFTVPTGYEGYYHVDSTVVFDGTAEFDAGEPLYLFLYLNNAEYCLMMLTMSEVTGSSTIYYTLHGGADVEMTTPGDYIDIRVQQVSSGARTLSATSSYVWVNIHKI